MSVPLKMRQMFILNSSSEMSQMYCGDHENFLLAYTMSGSLPLVTIRMCSLNSASDMSQTGLVTLGVFSWCVSPELHFQNIQKDATVGMRSLWKILVDVYDEQIIALFFLRNRTPILKFFHRDVTVGKRNVMGTFC